MLQIHLISMQRIADNVLILTGDSSKSSCRLCRLPELLVEPVLMMVEGK